MTIRLRPIDRIFILTLFMISLPVILLYMRYGKSLPVERLTAVAYLGNPIESPEIWRMDLNGSGQQKLTESSGKVFDFSISPDGEQFIFSVLNESGGSDLYRIDREGQNQQVMVECGQSHCVQSVWQEKSELFAYSRYDRGLEVDAVIRFIDVGTGEEVELYGVSNFEGAYPVFSPDGKYLAFYSFRNNAIKIIDLSTGDEVGTAIANPGYASWSRDGDAVYFTNTVLNGIIPQSRLYKFTLAAKKVEPFLAAELSGYDATQIEWSPDGEWGVFGLKDTDSQAGRQIYLVRKDGTDMHGITKDAGISHTAYHWSPSGEQIIYQRYSFGSGDMTPQIVIWDKKTDASIILIENGALPVWLP